MPYELLEKQIKALPRTAQLEVEHYVGYLTSLYCNNTQKESVSERINAFMKENPTAFEEFDNEAGLESIRKLTKNDVW